MCVHGVCDPYEPIEAVRGPVLTPRHRRGDLSETAKVRVLDEKAVFLEEGIDPIDELAQTADAVGQHAGTWAFRPDSAASVEVTDVFEQSSMVFVLVHLEDRRELPASGASGVTRVAVNRHREAAFTVHEPDEPPRIEAHSRLFGFLLIVRTGRIFTVHVLTL